MEVSASPTRDASGRGRIPVAIPVAVPVAVENFPRELSVGARVGCVQVRGAIVVGRVRHD